MPSLGVPSTWGLLLEEVALTWKLIKQFHLRANQRSHIPNAETRVLLTNRAPKKHKSTKSSEQAFVSLVSLCGSLRCVGVAAAFALK